MDIREILMYLTLLFFIGSMAYITLTIDKDSYGKKSV